MTWRYQPVYVEHESGERTYSLCEVYFDAAGRLERWTQEPMMTPSGHDIADLTGTLGLMLRAARRWEPVLFSDLHTGMALRSQRVARAKRKIIEKIKNRRNPT